MFRLLSINAHDLYKGESDNADRRFSGIEALIRNRDPDIVAVQELCAPGDGRTEKWCGAAAGVKRLATAIGCCYQVGDEPAVAVGGAIHHTALLWRDSAMISPVPGSLVRLERENVGMWHSAVAMVFELRGRPLRVGSVHLSPWSQSWCEQDATQLLRVFHGDGIPGVLGGDFNGAGADPIYDPDPYHVVWRPNHTHQLDDSGHVDRRAAHRMENLGRMVDCARSTGAPWIPTTGHHPDDQHPPRRPDRWYSSHHNRAVTGYRAAPLSELRYGFNAWLTDHRPIEIAVNERRLPDRDTLPE